MDDDNPTHRNCQIRYWPVVDLATGRIVGADAVTTWPGQSPTDRRAQLARTDQQLLDLVATHFGRGPAAAAGWWVSVALGSRRFARPAGPERFLDLLDRGRVPPCRVIIQLSEWDLSRMVEAGATDVLGDEGVRFSLIDVGSGHLTPAALRAVPLAHIRLELSRLHLGRPDDQELVRQIAAAASVLGARLLGEGVDRALQEAQVRRLGIDLVRGERWGGACTMADLLAIWG